MNFLCMDFINSQWSDHLGRKTEDKLDDPAWLKALLDKYDCHAEQEFDKAEMQKFKEFRSMLWKILVRVVEEEGVEPASLEGMNKYLSMTAYKYNIEYADNKYTLSRSSQGSNRDRAMGEIALSLAELLSVKELRRIKICKNPDCRWIFYDESKNRNKCWCEAKSCGNLMKVRRFRERKKGED